VRSGVLNTQFAVYVYQLTDGSSVWTIQKRFSEFDFLDRDLQEKYPKRMLKVDRIPRKSIFNSTSPSTLESRQTAFDAYLSQLLQELTDTPELQEFLEIPDLLENALSGDECYHEERCSSEDDHFDSLLSQAATLGL
jgi:hypothetical protein